MVLSGADEREESPVNYPDWFILAIAVVIVLVDTVWMGLRARQERKKRERQRWIRSLAQGDRQGDAAGKE